MTESGATLEAVDILGLMRRLPHRYPFLLVDKIIDINGDESGVGVKNVTINEPQFQGHFPERPIMPGVLIIEAMAQTAGAIALLASGEAAGGSLVYFVSIDKARFRKPVGPGDRVELHMRKTQRKRNIWWYEGKAIVDGVVVCEALISAMLGAG